MSRLPRIIGVTGYAQNGKDSVADVLRGAVGYRVERFSQALKDLALVADPIIICDNFEHLFDGPWRLSTIVNRVGWDVAKQHPEVRRFLIDLGTPGVRKIIGEDSWVAALAKRTSAYAPGTQMVIADVRFKNEAAWIRRMQGEVWRVTRPGFDSGVSHDDESERDVPTLFVDLEIVNDGTLAELQSKVGRYVTSRAVPWDDWNIDRPDPIDITEAYE